MRPEIWGKFHINLTPHPRDKRGRAPWLKTAKRAPLIVTIRAKSFILKGIKIRAGLSVKSQDSRAPPLKANGPKIHMPPVITRSSSDLQRRAPRLAGLVLVSKVKRRE